MDASYVLLVGITLALAVVGYLRGGWAVPVEGVRASGRMLVEVVPRLIVGFLMAGLFTAVVPTDLIARWMGQESGLRGILVGALAGVLTPGGPFVLFPLVAALYRQGAGAGPLAAYLTAWGLLPLHRVLVWELPFLGGAFTLARAGASLALPVVAGLLTEPLLRLLAGLARPR